MLRCRGDEVVSTVCDLVVVQPGPCTVTLDVGGPGSICASLFASDSGGIVPKGAAWTCRWPDCGILSLLPGEPPQQVWLQTAVRDPQSNQQVRSRSAATGAGVSGTGVSVTAAVSLVSLAQALGPEGCQCPAQDHVEDGEDCPLRPHLG